MKLSKMRSIIFLLFIFIIPILSILNSKEDLFLVSENRMISDFPSVSYLTITSGEFSKGLENYFEDRIVKREKILKYSTLLDLKYFKKPQIMDVAVSSDRKYLLDHVSLKETRMSLRNMEKGIRLLRSIQDYVEERGGKMLTIVFPRQSYVLADHYPEYMLSKRELYDQMKKKLLP